MYDFFFKNADQNPTRTQSTIDSEGFKGGTRGAPIMPRDAVSRTANVERNGGQKWVNHWSGTWNRNANFNNLAEVIRIKLRIEERSRETN